MTDQTGLEKSFDERNIVNQFKTRNSYSLLSYLQSAALWGPFQQCNIH